MKQNYQIKRIGPQQTWDLRHRVMWPDRPMDYVKLDEDHNGLHFGLEVDSQLISIISVFIEGGKAQFRKFATDKSHQGMGFGSHLLAHVIKLLEENEIALIWCNARVEKTAFYEKFGLAKTDKTFQKGGIDYVIMEKQVAQDSIG
ncbi:GNAT family N-acetyltransferase [Echinicola salinicaeni]|uniref:GNAT family N-acetyltransferase n=1 Tax=Echinicola salinicaeni TaxID=2762757 RepID=UPI001E51A6EB|nr:GNAT family N-acetyltransferase [Echinicola salinicaeni]